MDQVSVERIKKLHPKIREEVLSILNQCEKRGVLFRIAKGYRSIKEQDDLYAQGRTTPGKIVTNAKGGSSWHNYGLAFDIVLLHADKTVSWDRNEDLDKDSTKDWMEVVDECSKHGFDWGGNWQFKDYPHFQKTFGMTLTKVKELISSRKVDSDNYIIF